MSSTHDISSTTLNSINIRRFTEAVLTRHGATINRDRAGPWEVSLPEELATELSCDEKLTLVFDQKNREPGRNDYLVAPGTQFFRRLIEFTKQSPTIGHITLSEENLQVRVPKVLQEAPLTAQVETFEEHDERTALAFHFAVQFVTSASYEQQEAITIVVDRKTKSVRPDIGARFTAHLPRLLDEQGGQPVEPLPNGTVQSAYRTAKETAVEAVRGTIDDLQTEANDHAAERITEIKEKYDQRRRELDSQVDEQQEKIRELAGKISNARKVETRQRYTRQHREAKQELETLENRVEEKKQQLAEEEQQQIEEAVDRNTVSVEFDLLGITQVTYQSGTLHIGIENDRATANVETEYTPATDECQTLPCATCGRDLTDGVLPRLCAEGHLVGDPCITRCRTCGIGYCGDCSGGQHRFVECSVCWEQECTTCSAFCTVCDQQVCETHRAECTVCGEVTCRLCGQECDDCGTFHCDDHLQICPVDEGYFCADHLTACDICGAERCADHTGSCVECGERVCEDHQIECAVCDDVMCPDHHEECAHCERKLCQSHREECAADGELLCPRHAIDDSTISGVICESHQTDCDVCSQGYPPSRVQGDRCPACRQLKDGGAVDQIGVKIPTEIRDEFSSLKVGASEKSIVVLGSKRFRRDRIIILDRGDLSETRREKVGVLSSLTGGI